MDSVGVMYMYLYWHDQLYTACGLSVGFKICSVGLWMCTYNPGMCKSTYNAVEQYTRQRGGAFLCSFVASYGWYMDVLPAY